MKKYSDYSLVCVLRTYDDAEKLNETCILCSKIMELDNGMVLMEIPYKLAKRKETLYNRKMQNLL